MVFNRLEHCLPGRAGNADTLRVAIITAVLLLPFAAAAQNSPSFRWIQEVDNSGLAYPFAGLGTDAQGNTYIAGSTKSLNFPVKNAVRNHSASPGSYDVFVTKLDPSGAIVYSTYFGGSADDITRAMTADAAGNVYVVGTTASLDFPTTPGSWSPTMPPGPEPGLVPGSAYEGAIFLFKLNPDGSLAYSTYFTSSFAPTDPQGVAVDVAGAAYLTGVTYGGVPTTAGAYQPACACQPYPGLGFIVPISDAFAAKFDPTGSKLVYATYLGVAHAAGNAIAVGPDGSAYLGSPTGVYRFDPTGSSLIASMGPVMSATAMAVAQDGRVYLAGAAGTGANQFQTTAPAFQSNAGALPTLPAQGGGPALGIMVMDASLHTTAAATYFGQYGGIAANAMALDASGNVYIGGGAKVGLLPTRTPLQEGFGGSLETGFAAELSDDLSTLLFSSYFGDGDFFYVAGLGIGSNGGVSLAGATDHGAVWANSVQPAAMPSLRIDAVVNAASQLDNPISAAETITIRGAGFGSDAVLLLNGVAVPAISVAPDRITAAIPSNLANGPATVQVQSGGTASNQVLLNVAKASPGMFSADGSGVGQGYILNKDGSLNSPSNPAAPGDKITIYATGVGPVSFTNGYAVTQYPADLYIDGFHCDGLAAVMDPASGLPGAVYQLTVIVPNPATMAASNPNLLNFIFPPQVGVVLQIDGASSQNGLAISVGQIER
jgi:uncharacterized protein (TIGR03437 family)